MSPGRLHLTYGKKCQKLFMITMLDLIQIGVYLIQWCSDGSSALREDRLSRFDKKCDWLSSFGKKCDWLSVKKKRLDLICLFGIALLFMVLRAGSATIFH